METAAARMVRGQDPIRHRVRRKVRLPMTKNGLAHEIPDTPRFPRPHQLQPQTQHRPPPPPLRPAPTPQGPPLEAQAPPSSPISSSEQQAPPSAQPPRP